MRPRSINRNTLSAASSAKKSSSGIVLFHAKTTIQVALNTAVVKVAIAERWKRTERWLCQWSNTRIGRWVKVWKSQRLKVLVVQRRRPRLRHSQSIKLQAKDRLTISMPLPSTPNGSEGKSNKILSSAKDYFRETRRSFIRFCSPVPMAESSPGIIPSWRAYHTCSRAGTH